MPDAATGCGNCNKYKMASTALFTRWWPGMPRGPIMPQKDRVDTMLEARNPSRAHRSHARLAFQKVCEALELQADPLEAKA
jgi:hypothetical protein